MNRKIVRSIGPFLRPVYLCALCCILLSYSCNKNEGSPDPVKEQDKSKEPEKPDPPLNTALVPSTIKSQNLLLTFKYDAEKNLLMELVQSDGWLTKFFYRSDQTPMEVEYYKDNKLQQSVGYIFNKDGRLDKIALFDKNSISYGFYLVVQDEGRRTTQLKKYDAKGKLMEEENISYDELGNITKIILTNNGKMTTMSSTYDDRPGIYRNITHFQLLFLAHPQQQARALYSISNPLRLDYLPSGTSSSIYTYEYNSSGYPSSLQVTQGNFSEALKMTYKTLKPK